jgi:phage shock protein PspC (stress-responsive transcriptional regulator)
METVNETPPPHDAPPPGATPPPRAPLTRSTDDQVLAGLCGGLGRYFGLDPMVFRIAFVVLTMVGGSGILLYLLGWLLISDDKGGGVLSRVKGARNQKLVAAVLAGAGALLLLDELTDDGDVPFGLVLVGFGALVLWSRQRQDRAGGGSPTPPAPPAPSPPATPTRDAAPVPSPPGDAVPTEAEDPPDDTAKSRSTLVPVTLSLLAVLAGGLTLLGVSVTTGLALALLLTGSALVVGAWRGRARWLIPVGLVLAAALAAVSVIDVPVRGGAGDVTYRPASVQEIRSPYRLGAGTMVVDLRDVDLHGRTVRLVASVAAGRLEVVVPGGASVDVEAGVGAGEVDVLGRRAEGLDVGRDVVQPGNEGGGRLVLNARAGVGSVEVRRAPA